MYMKRRKRLSQTFLLNDQLAQRLVDDSSINSHDTVFEFGAGDGIITQHLSKVAKHVVAIEIDERYDNLLRHQFKHVSSVEVIHADALLVDTSESAYKVFANIPFAIEGKLTHKLLDSKNPPDDMYVIVRKDFGERITGIKHSHLLSVLRNPWFEMTIPHRFYAGDFSPKTKVNAVMVRFMKRLVPLIPWDQRFSYEVFVRSAYGDGDCVYRNLKRHFQLEVIRHVFHDELSLPTSIKPSAITNRQWWYLFRYFANST